MTDQDEARVKANDEKAQALASEDTVAKAFEGASDDDNKQAAKLAQEELQSSQHDDKGITHVPAPDMFERALKSLMDLRAVYRELGYRLASWGYVGVTVGTSVGLSIGLEPIPDAEHKANPETGELDTLQAIVVGLIKRVNSVLDDLQESAMRLDRLSISISGVGLAIPSATATLSFADVPADEAQEADKDRNEAETESRQKSGGSLLSKYAQQLSNFVRRPFTATTAPLVRTLLDEVTDLRRTFSHMGLTVGNLDGSSGWLKVSIGTYFGIGFSVNFLDAFSPDTALPEGLSVLQRAVLGSIVNAYTVAVRATADTLSPKSVYVSLSGIGLAIPSVTTTVYMAQAGDEQEEALRTLATKLAEEKAEARGAEEQHAAQQPAGEEGRRFVTEEEGEQEGGGSVVANITRSTIRTIYASGEKAGKALHATTDALKNSVSQVTRAATSPIKEALRKMLTVQDCLDSLPLKLGSPCLSITVGTHIGTSVRFVERSGMNILRDPPSITADKSSPLAVQQLLKALNFLQKAPGALYLLRHDHAHADLVTLSFSGLGLGIPSITTSIYLGYTE